MQSLVTGPYGAYLLIAYGVTAVVVVGNIVAARRRLATTRRRLREQLERREASRSGAAPASGPVGREPAGQATKGRG
jgi:heme exporter protein CcmD